MLCYGLHVVAYHNIIKYAHNFILKKKCRQTLIDKDFNLIREARVRQVCLFYPFAANVNEL